MTYLEAVEKKVNKPCCFDEEQRFQNEI